MPQFLLSYKCPRCGYEWNDTWDCEVDDECGECGERHISPIEVTDLDDEDDD